MNVKQLQILKYQSSDIQVMSEKIYKLIDYFRNYSFSNDSMQPFSNNSLQTNAPHNKQGTNYNSALQSAFVTKLRTQLEQSIIHGKSLIDLYEQRLDEVSTEKEMILQEIQNLKQTLKEQKAQSQKILSSTRDIAQEMRKELIEKHQENKTLTDRIQSLENDRADELNFLKNQEKEEAFIREKTINQSILKYENIIKTLSEELSEEKSLNQGLMQRITLLEQDILKLSQENTKTKQTEQELRKIIKSQKEIQPHSPKDNSISLDPSLNEEVFGNELQVFYVTQEEFNPHFQGQILNESPQKGTALKDVLNYSDYKSNGYDRSGGFLRSDEKQNIYDNLTKTNKMNSQGKNTHSTPKGTLFSRQSPRIFPRAIQEFRTTDQSSIGIFNDPYYAYFTLSAQCIKINSQYFQQIAEVDVVREEWENVIQHRVPMNLWQKHLEKAMLKAVGIVI